jgi:hypothetical protein
MDYKKTFYWTIQLKQPKNCFEEDRIINILDQIVQYIPEFNDYGKYEDDGIINYLLRTNRNTGRVEISSTAIDFYFDNTESNRDWFDYPRIVFDIIYNSEIVLPLSIDYIKRSSISKFSTKINHGEIMYKLFLENNNFAKLLDKNKIMSYTPDMYILLDKNNSIYNEISFRSESSNIEDMELSYLKSEELLVWFEILKNRGFSPKFNFSNYFNSLNNYFDDALYRNFIDIIEKPIFEYIKNEESKRLI